MTDRDVTKLERDTRIKGRGINVRPWASDSKPLSSPVLVNDELEALDVVQTEVFREHGDRLAATLQPIAF